MGQRRVLVIGSQCDALEALDFLPELAERLYEVFTDPNIGMCLSALEGQKGLLINHSVRHIEAAIIDAFAQASKQGDTLILSLIGHGVGVGNDFYYMAKDSPAHPRSNTAVNLVQVIKENYYTDVGIDGLIVLIDTCQSGIAAKAAAQAWISELDFSTRFEILTATGQDAAYDGCFTHILIDVLRNGLSTESSETLRCFQLSAVVDQDEACGQKQESSYVACKPDPGLFLAKNVSLGARRQPWVITGMWSEIEQHTQYFQPTPQLRAIVEAAANQRCLALIGKAGSGKSTLMAALARPEVTEGMVPDSFLHAIVFLSETTDSVTLSIELSYQLQSSVEGFTEALQAYEASILPEEWNKMETLQRSVLAPLQRLAFHQFVRIGVDALDQLPESATLGVYRVLNHLVQDQGLAHIQLVVSSRPDTDLPVGAEPLWLEEASNPDLMAYLTRRNVSPQYQEVIVERASGSWLVARLLADLALEENLNPTELPHHLVEIYDQILLNLGAVQRNDRWRRQLRPVLGILAVSGVGSVLPISLLCNASGRLWGSSKISQIRDLLVDLCGFVDRRSPGTADEQDGLFHATFSEYLRDATNGMFSVEVEEAKAALVETIAELAPMQQHDSKNQLHQYAATIEAQLLWELGRQGQAIESLSQRESVIPRENLAYWSSWYRFIQEQLLLDHPVTLIARGNIARYTGESGDARGALTLFQQLLPDQERVLGKDHPGTPTTRGNIALWTGKSGDARGALALFQQLLPDQERVLGKDHPDTLIMRSEIALWTGESGDARGALMLLQQLLPDQERVLGQDHPDTFTTRSHIAGYTGEGGDARGSLTLLQQLLLDQERVLGKDHPNTLTTRGNIALWTRLTLPVARSQGILGSSNRLV